MISFCYRKFLYFFGILIIFGCASTTPKAPKIAVMTAPGKPFDQFVLEDKLCRQYAEEYIGSSPKSATGSGVGTALAGTALGTAAGALIGGREGAATGAGVGLIGGSIAGSGQTSYEAHDIQWSYDTAYAQCMYAKGNQVPGYQTQQQVAPTLPPKGERK